MYHLSGHIQANNTSGSSTTFATKIELQGTPTLTNTPPLLYYSVYSTTEKLGNYESDVLLTAGQTITVRIEIKPSGSETTETFATDDPAFGIWRDRDETANHLLTGNPVEDSPLANSRLLRRLERLNQDDQDTVSRSLTRSSPRVG